MDHFRSNGFDELGLMPVQDSAADEIDWLAINEFHVVLRVSAQETPSEPEVVPATREIAEGWR